MYGQNCFVNHNYIFQGPAELKAYKYNEDKTLNFLESKVRILAKYINDKNFNVTSGSTAATFICSSLSNASIDEGIFNIE